MFITCFVVQCLVSSLHCLLRREKMQHFSEIITCDPSIYVMDHPGLTVLNFMENSIGPKRVNYRLMVAKKILYHKHDMKPNVKVNHCL